MAVTKADRRELLSGWIQPSSPTEQDQQNRAERMVLDAVANHRALDSVRVDIYAKGSYANNTNVRLDSDVDIVVQCQECVYYDFESPSPYNINPGAYNGLWTPERWRREVTLALSNHFGSAGIDDSGAIAIKIKPVTGSRPSADVVPSFDYFRYTRSNRSEWHDGSTVFTKQGEQIVNWPKQQLDNGIEKNKASGGRYKNYVRALKNAENFLSDRRVIAALPSYFMECLVWNVSDSALQEGDLVDGFQATLYALWKGLEGSAAQDWAEPNELKWLFRGQKWTIAQGKQLVIETWKLLEYDLT